MKAVDKFGTEEVTNFQHMPHGGLDKQLQGLSPIKQEQLESCSYD